MSDVIRTRFGRWHKDTAGKWTDGINCISERGDGTYLAWHDDGRLDGGGYPRLPIELICWLADEHRARKLEAAAQADLEGGA